MSKKKNKNEKRIIRSDLSGKAVNGKDVILVSEAEEYLKVNGYKIISPAEITMTIITSIAFLMYGGLLILR